MKPFDCHNHIYAKEFDADRDKILKESEKVLFGMIVVGEDHTSNLKVLELKKKYQNFIFAGLAIHPDKVHLLPDEEIEKETAFIKKQRNLACIGECGLDYLWAKKSGNYEETKLRQQETFRKFIKLAKKINLPLNVHSRWAMPAVLKILKEEKAKRVLLHAFEGTVAEAKQAYELGYKISMGNTISFSEQKQSVVKSLPLDALVMETDSPVCSAVKGERNVPANILLVVKEIAKIKKVSEGKVIERTNKNVKELFGI